MILAIHDEDGFLVFHDGETTGEYAIGIAPPHYPVLAIYREACLVHMPDCSVRFVLIDKLRTGSGWRDTFNCLKDYWN